jgi:hypothetical protein
MSKQRHNHTTQVVVKLMTGKSIFYFYLWDGFAELCVKRCANETAQNRLRQA